MNDLPTVGGSPWVPNQPTPAPPSNTWLKAVAIGGLVCSLIGVAVLGWLALGNDGNDGVQVVEQRQNSSRDRDGDDQAGDDQAGDDQAGDVDPSPPGRLDGKVGLAFDLGGTGDQSFNDAAAAGLGRAANEFGFDTTALVLDEVDQNRVELLENLASNGHDPVIAVGFLYSDAVLEVAQQHPDTTFAIIDNAYGPDDQPQTKNIKQLVFAEEQGAFLIGAAAAMTTEPTRLGFIGGVETDLIKKFEVGYTAGVKHVNPELQIEASYLSQPPDFGGFDDAIQAKADARSMYEGGVEIVFHAAGGSSSGLFEAAVEARGSNDNIWAIGVDSDQYLLVPDDQREIMLTSLVKKVDVAVERVIADVAAGDTDGGVITLGIAEDGVGYATSGGHIDGITDDLDQLANQISSGEITVPTT